MKRNRTETRWSPVSIPSIPEKGSWMAAPQQGGITTRIHGPGGEEIFRGGPGKQVVPLTPKNTRANALNKPVMNALLDLAGVAKA
jgi:hypothetical protein